MLNEIESSSWHTSSIGSATRKSNVQVTGCETGRNELDQWLAVVHGVTRYFPIWKRRPTLRLHWSPLDENLFQPRHARTPRLVSNKSFGTVRPLDERRPNLEIVWNVPLVVFINLSRCWSIDRRDTHRALWRLGLTRYINL